MGALRNPFKISIRNKSIQYTAGIRDKNEVQLQRRSHQDLSGPVFGWAKSLHPPPLLFTFPSPPHLGLPFPSPLSPLRSRPLKYSQEVWGALYAPPSGVWAPENEFGCLNVWHTVAIILLIFRVLAHLSKSNSRTFQGPYKGYIRRTKLKQASSFISISRRSGPLKSS